MASLRERKKEQTRQRIAAVALRLFAERGFDAVTVNEVAEAAEVAKATLFAYFPTKESLVLAASEATTWPGSPPGVRLARRSLRRSGLTSVRSPPWSCPQRCWAR